MIADASISNLMDRAERFSHFFLGVLRDVAMAKGAEGELPALRTI